MTERIDYFGNPATFSTIQEPHRQLSVTAINVTELAPTPPARGRSRRPPWENVARPALPTTAARTSWPPASSRSTRPTSAAATRPRRLRRAVVPAGPAPPRGRPRPDAADPRRVPLRPDRDDDRHPAHGGAEQPPRRLPGLRPPPDRLPALARPGRPLRQRLPATRPAPGRPRLIGADASHAWVSFFCPGFGWIDVDPTNNLVPCDQHIILAWGRDYDDVSPIKGVILGGGTHTVKVRSTSRREQRRELRTGAA